MDYMKSLKLVALILVIVGALNWLSAGVMGKDLVSKVLGDNVARPIYVLVGVAGVVLAACLLMPKKDEKKKENYMY